MGAGLLGGAGLIAMTGGASAQSGLSMTAADPTIVSNDRGELTKVTTDPQFRVEWANFDQAVGKVLFLVEARTQEDGEWQTRNPASASTDYFVPIFRATPWLTKNKKQNGDDHIDYSKPGTTGYLEFKDPISKALHAAVYHRTGSVPSDVPRPIEVVNEAGRPDYASLDYSDHASDLDRFLLGTSIGGAADDFDLANHFPGAEAGLYGAAIGTGDFDVPTDGVTDVDVVELRYTVALLTVNDSWRGADYAGPDSWFADVPDDEVTQGHSTLAMEGDGEYPSVTDHGAGSASAKYYPAYHEMADSHPAVLVDTVAFEVGVENELSTNDGSGDSNTGAE